MRVVSFLLVSIMGGPLAGCAAVPNESTEAPTIAAANQPIPRGKCVGVNVLPKELPKAREAECLKELPDTVVRDRTVLTLRLENGKTRTFRGSPSACWDQEVPDCTAYWLVGFQPSARLFVVHTIYREGYDVRLVSASTGAVTKYESDLPHFSPDRTHFIITVTSPFVERKYDMAIGSVADGKPKLVWQRSVPPSDTEEEWQVESWLDNDHVALFTTTKSLKCPNGNCRATLVRSGKTWTLQAVSPKASS